MISSGINLVMTVIGFAVSAMFIVFVCTRLICARIQLSASRRSFPVASRSDLSSLERGFHCLEPFIIANFPIKKYSDEYFCSSKDDQCIVCLAEYREEDTLRILPYCGHFFHANCIDIWLHQHSTCPVCRMSLRECPEKKRLMQPMYSSAVRYSYSMECLNTTVDHCVYTSHRIPSRAHESHRMDPIQEDQIPSLGGGAEPGENISASIESSQIAKVSGIKHHVESPSDP